MYKYAIIGFGGLGKLHLTNLMQLEKERGDFKLCALCGADPNAFKENVKINLGNVDIGNIDFSSIGFYQDYKELIEKEKPDFILSTLPTYMHEEVAVYALNKGVHVFSEKPMALTEAACENMIKAAKENGKKLMIGQCLRFDPTFEKIKEYIDEKTFGKVYRAEFFRYSQTPTWTWNNWILDPKQSGGCIIDMHIHDVDVINWLFGMPKALRAAKTEKKVELESIFTQYFYDDLLVTSAADWSMTQTFPFEQRCLFNFEKATVCVDDGKLTVYTDDESFSPEISGETNLMQEMRAFLKYVIDGEECSATSPESVKDSISLAFKELEAANTLNTINL